MIHGDSNGFQDVEILCHAGPSPLDAILGGQFLSQGGSSLIAWVCLPGCRRSAAVSGDLRSHPLRDPAFGRRVAKNVSIRVGVDINESRSDMETGHVQDTRCLARIDGSYSPDLSPNESNVPLP